MRTLRWTAGILVLLVLFVCLTDAAAWLLIPPRTDFGATWEAYLREEEDTVDVLLFGSSLVYCNIVPSVIWQESGVTSYLMAGPEQTIPLSYRYIKEACRTQSPKVIGLEVTGMFYREYCDFSKANVAYMPWSVERLAATFDAVEPELRAPLLFPILDYHSRWSSVTGEELMTHLNPQADPFAGYTYLEKITPQDEVTERDFGVVPENYARNLNYLRRIAEFCEERGAQLMLFVTPSKGRIPKAELAKLAGEIEALPGAVHFVDFNTHLGVLNIDDAVDWHDFIHFNRTGAEKFSRFLGEWLPREFDLSPTADEDEALWQSRVEEFETRMQ